MSLFAILFMSLMFTEPEIIYDFNEESTLRNWRIVDDVVMGGRSQGIFGVSKQGHGVFMGEVSLENNGGFSSVRYRFREMDVDADQNITLKVKGDGKRYEFRVKHSRRAYYSYNASFKTSGEWETIKLPLKDMYPAFRGRNLNLPNFDHSSIEEITFLFGNKKPESFQLQIDSISIE
jgi:hypothetical protein